MMIPALLLSMMGAAHAAVLDYPISKKTLPNGLDVVVIETPEFKDVLSYNTMVLAGSGKEQERGKTGLAHLFEHILFRHRFGGVDGGYDEAINRMGAHNNAWTWFDVTFYHPLTFTGNLQRLLDLEFERFMALDFTEKTFKTEAGAVLGEYRKNASQPSEKMDERLSALMFPNHPYGHTTMGYAEDVLDMPNQFAAAKRFYAAYYRPNNCVVVVAGDVKAPEIFREVERRAKDWKSQPIPPVDKTGATPKQEQREDLSWDSDVAPLVWVAYRMPAFAPGSRESAAAELLSELLVSPAAPLYKKLRYEKQAVSELGFQEGAQGFESVDPRLLTIGAQLFKDKHAAKGKAYFDEVAQDIEAGVDDLKAFSKQLGASELLGKVKSKYRYDFLAGLSSPAGIASTFAWYYRFNRDPKAVETLLDSVQALEPADIDAFAAKHFTPDNRVVLTLAYQPAKKGS